MYENVGKTSSHSHQACPAEVWRVSPTATVLPRAVFFLYHLLCLEFLVLLPPISHVFSRASVRGHLLQEDTSDTTIGTAGLFSRTLLRTGIWNSLMHCPSPLARLSLWKLPVLLAFASSPALLLGQLCDATEQRWLRENCFWLRFQRLCRTGLWWALGRVFKGTNKEWTNKQMCSVHYSRGWNVSTGKSWSACLAFSVSDLGSEIDVSGCPHPRSEAGRLYGSQSSPGTQATRFVHVCPALPHLAPL